MLTLAGVRGEAGTAATALVTLTATEARSLKAVRVNGVEAAHDPAIPAGPEGLVAVRVPLRFAGAPFGQYQQVGEYDPAFAGGRWSGRFNVPQRILDQLAARQNAWPIPWTAEDYRTTWLAPQRLLLFVQIAEPDDRWEATLRIDGKVVELKKAYTAVRVARRTFVGFYADLSLVAPDREHSIELELPTLRPGQFQGVFFENVEPEYTSALR